MANGNRIQDLLRDSKHPAAPAPPVEVSSAAASPCVVSNRESFMLDLELVGGDRLALPYSSLRGVRMNPSTVLVVTFETHTVTITGVNLLAIYEALVLRAVGTLKAVGERPRAATNGVPVIFKIAVVERE